MKKMIFTGVLATLLLAACGEAAPAIITEKTFKQLEKGLTYDEVQTIVGGSAKSETVIEEGSIIEYSFDSDTDEIVSLIFTDGKLDYILGYEEDQEKTEEVEVTPNFDWPSKINEIANGSGTETEKFDAVMLLAKDYTTNQSEAEQFKSDIISEFKNKNYLIDIKNDEYMLSMIFKTRIVETYYLNQTNEALKSFAFDMHQNLKYTYRGVDAVDSDAVLSNERQMDKALSKLQ